MRRADCPVDCASVSLCDEAGWKEKGKKGRERNLTAK